MKILLIKYLKLIFNYFKIKLNVYSFYIFLIIMLIFGVSLQNCNQEKNNVPEDFSTSPYYTSNELRNNLAELENTSMDLMELLLVTKNIEKYSSEDIKRVIESYKDLRNTSPLWPIYIYFVGEIYRLQNDIIKSKDAYCSLVEWAASDPYKDGWGGSGLSLVALWRLLSILKDLPNPDPKEILHLFGMIEKIIEKRLAYRMMNSQILNNLPLFEEEILRYMGMLAWSIGEKEQAQRFYLDYLKVASKYKMDSFDKTMIDQLETSGLASGEYIRLFRARRLFTLKMYDKAFEIFVDLEKSNDLYINTQAMYHLALIKKINEEPRKKIIELLDATIEKASFPDLVQKALIERAIIYKHAGKGENIDLFLKDLSKLISEFPRGQLTDDALFLLANYHQFERNVDKALYYFEQLRDFKGKNDWTNSAFFRPAIALYKRNLNGDIEKSSKLLEMLEEQNPVSAFHLGALFWLGRMAEESGEKGLSKKYFQRVIDESPYNYYAIRARMHLNTGDSAKKELRPDSNIISELNAAYQNSVRNDSIDGNSPYHIRLRNAIKTGVYSMALSMDRQVRKLFPSKRIEEITLNELDKEGLLIGECLLLSLRQDAMAAVDKNSDNIMNRLQIAAALGYIAKDWPLSISVSKVINGPNEILWATQRDSRYLSTAFPPVFAEYIKKYSIERDVKAELLYSIIKNESLFYIEALSKMGALGLFQFTPKTFNTLNDRWGLLKAKGKESGVAFLLDPNDSIYLGARWFKEELLKHQQGNILFALMEHNAGYSEVKKWKKYWEKLGEEEDIEYIIETIPIGQTRIFVKEVVSDMILAEASGILK